MEDATHRRAADWLTAGARLSILPWVIGRAAVVGWPLLLEVLTGFCHAL